MESHKQKPLLDGDFNVDILAEEENTGRKVIIENQLEATNHEHLGKLMTYAAGHDAEIIIWVVKEAREEHRHAVDWINDHTDGKINIFIVKLELWQIGESPYAPKFQVVSSPNDWARAIKESVARGNLSDTKALQLEFWNKFKEYAQNKKTKLRLRNTSPQHWYDISYGSSQSHIALTINTQSDTIACEIYIGDSKSLFAELSKHKQEIEQELGEKLEWMELPGKKASRIKLSKEGAVSETAKWEEYFEWLKTKAEDFQKAFLKYAKDRKSVV